jgi:hypothetical protein
MLAQDLLNLRTQLRDAGIIFTYCGYVTEQVLAGVGDALKQKLLIEETDTKTARSVFAVFVEQTQNIIRYSAEKTEPQAQTNGEATPPSELSYGIITVSRDDDAFVIKAGNLIEKSDVERLRALLEQIRNADREELKAMYKETLKGEVPEGSKGAGVGFIEIARRSSRPIQFDFTDVDGHFSFFALETEI